MQASNRILLTSSQGDKSEDIKGYKLFVGHGQLAAETVEHLERGPVLGVLLGDLLGEELLPGHLHTRQQGSQPVEKSFNIATHD